MNRAERHNVQAEGRNIPLVSASCVHVNFPALFIESHVAQHIAEVQDVVEGAGAITDLVLNLEKCQWVELVPIVQLLAVLLRPLNAPPRLHVVGPYPHVLPYLKQYVSDARSKLDGADDALRLAYESKIARHERLLPSLRAKAGAFLLGWGVFDAIEEHYPNSIWYTAREQRVSLAEFRRAYPFGHGASAQSAATTSDRVMPISVVYREGQTQAVSQLSSEELVSGPLRHFAGADVIADGALQSILFYEPFENVFAHAYDRPSQRDSGIFAMRLIGWMYDDNGDLTPQANWLLDRSDPEYSRFIKSIRHKTFIELVVGDSGQGIPSALGEAYRARSAEEVFLPTEANQSDDDWQVIRFAFEEDSTSRPDSPAGLRGLSWVRSVLLKEGGFVQVLSNSGLYSIDGSNPLTQEVGRAIVGGAIKSRAGNRSWVRGTFLRIVVPLDSDLPRKALDRRPQWPQSDSRTSDLFTSAQPFKVWKFGGLIDSNACPALAEMEAFAGQSDHFVVIDFGGSQPTRHELERFFGRLLDRASLRDRVVAINATRHMVCRLDTIVRTRDYLTNGVLLPIFETSLRSYWIGASSRETEVLIRLLRGGGTDGNGDAAKLNSSSPLFMLDHKGAFRLRFTFEDIEQCVRDALGRELWESLSSRYAVLRGRFVLPFAKRKSVSLYIEPHQLFSDTVLASRLCNHIAILLRWRYAKAIDSARGPIKVLTTTRIGRDFSVRMPDAYPADRFVHFDGRGVKPEKVRLHKHLVDGQVVIVVDIVTGGMVVEELIRACDQAGCVVLGVISLVDFSPGQEQLTRFFVSKAGAPIEHLTFFRRPTVVSASKESDTYVDPNTLSIEPTRLRPISQSTASELHGLAAIRFLDDAGALYRGHYEVFGHHFQYVVDVPRLLTAPSIYREALLRASEQAILSSRAGVETAIVLYPDIGSAHLLRAGLERRPRIRRRLLGGDLRLVEARHAFSSQSRTYWLTRSEVDTLRRWAVRRYPGGYAVVIIDDGTSSGSTLIALLELAKNLNPTSVGSFVLINRMSAAQATHYSEVEKLVWATTDFSSFLHLELPTYSSDNCPLCRERTELLREEKNARTDWLVGHIQRSLSELEIQSVISAHMEDLPPRHQVESRFRWEQETIYPAGNASYAGRAAAAWLAMNSRVSIAKIFRDVSDQCDDDLWRMIILDVARRTDLQQAQRKELPFCSELLDVAAFSSTSRRVAALHALRLMRPETLLPNLKCLLESSYLASEEVASEIILLLRHVFSYRHLAGEGTLESEIAIVKQLDARGEVDPSIRAVVGQIINELVRGRQPLFDCYTLVRKLERILKTARRYEHSFLYVISQYISDRRYDESTEVVTAVDEAIAIGILGEMLADSVLSSRRPVCNEMREAASAITRTARELSTLMSRRMREKTGGDQVLVREKTEEVRTHIPPIIDELRTLYIDLRGAVAGTLSAWSSAVELDDKVDVDIKLSIPTTPVFVVIDRGLGRDIINNLIANLRHATDHKSMKLSARISISSNGDEVELSCECSTIDDPVVRVAVSDCTSEDLAMQARLFGVRRAVIREEPWHEIWRFRRL